MVRCVRVLVVLGLVFVLAGQASAAGQGKGKGSKGKTRSGERPVFGVVESVSGDKLTVKVHSRKSKGGTASDKTFTLNGSTKYSSGFHARGGKKGGKSGKGGTTSASSLKKGERVLVLAKGNVAERVVVMHGHQGGKGKGKGKATASSKTKKAA